MLVFGLPPPPPQLQRLASGGSPLQKGGRRGRRLSSVFNPGCFDPRMYAAPPLLNSHSHVAQQQSCDARPPTPLARAPLPLPQPGTRWWRAPAASAWAATTWSAACSRTCPTRTAGTLRCAWSASCPPPPRARTRRRSGRCASAACCRAARRRVSDAGGCWQEGLLMR